MPVKQLFLEFWLEVDEDGNLKPKVRVYVAGVVAAALAIAAGLQQMGLF